MRTLTFAPPGLCLCSCFALCPACSFSQRIPTHPKRPNPVCSEKPLLTPLYRVTVSPFSVLGSHHPYSVASVTCLYICPPCWAIPQEEKLSLFLLFSTWYNAWCAGGKAFVEYLRALTCELILLKPPAYPLQQPTSWTSLNSPACGRGSLNTFSPETVSSTLLSGQKMP